MDRIFWMVALFFGIIYVIIIPPFQAPDEVHHFYRSYHIAEGHWFGERTDDQRFGGELPQSLQELADEFRYLRYAPTQKTSLEHLRKAAKIPLQKTTKTFLDFPNVAYYATTAYIPQAIAVKIGSLLDLPPLFLLYSTRFVNVLFWIIVVYFAIRVFPFHQNTMRFLALLPASLVFHSGINADAVTNALCFLLLAYLLQLIFSSRLFERKHIYLLIISFIITINKVVYAPLFLLAWLIPIKKYGGKKYFLLVNLGLLLLHCFVLLFWYKIASDSFIPYDEYNPLYRADKQLNPGVDPIAQLSFILQEPFRFIEILWNSYVEIFPYTLIHYVGKFGWEANYLPLWTLLVLLISIIIIPLLDNAQTVVMNWKHRLGFTLIGTIMMLAFSIVIYMQWNMPADSKITALSGRYFIPIFPLFLLNLYQHKLNANQHIFSKSLIIIILGANSICICNIILRYFS